MNDCASIAQRLAFQDLEERRFQLIILDLRIIDEVHSLKRRCQALLEAKVRSGETREVDSRAPLK